MGRVLVVGGSGFIGIAVQRYVLNRGMGSSFTFTYNKSQEKVLPGLDRIGLDLLSDSYDTDLSSYSTAIYLAGNSDHGLAKRDPSRDLKLNAGAFLNFSSQFNGSLVMLSSQAVYFG
jgi:nucleoside-diphosphate-sugar epimerase